MEPSEVSKLVIEGETEAAVEWTNRALEAGFDPLVIINEGLIPGMDVVGEKFQNREYFMPEMLVSAKAMKGCLAIVKPLLTNTDGPSGPVAICGTVQGDLHDIGVNLVGMMLEGAGFEVIHLGPDNPPDEFLRVAEENNAQVICLSAMLTTTIKNMKATIDRATELEMRNRVKIYVGGAPVTDDFANDIGSDSYSPDAGSAVKMIKEQLGMVSRS